MNQDDRIQLNGAGKKWGESKLSENNLRSEIFQRLVNNEFNCEKELTMSIISGKYKVVIIWHLGNERPYRYGEMNRLFPKISNRILTKQLRELEQDGIIQRIEYSAATLHVEYSLTDLGWTLLPVVNHIYQWGQEHMEYYVRRMHAQNGTTPPDKIIPGTVLSKEPEEAEA